MLGCTLVVAVCTWNTHAVCAQLGGVGHSTSTSSPVFQKWRDIPEVARCGVCHYQPGNEFASRNTDFCSLTETRIWLESDSHALSAQRVLPIPSAKIQEARNEIRRFMAERNINDPISPENLWVGESNVISHQICEALGYKTHTPQGWQLFRDNCLSCHAGFCQTNEFVNAAGFSYASPRETPPGISCSYCHQHGSNSAWLAEHASAEPVDTWRLKTPAQKAALGLRHLADSRGQAELCVDCHVGNQSRGMFVTHPMYAAGHPPLPAFELATFARRLPQHWRNESQTLESLQQWPNRSAYFEQTLAVGTPPSDASSSIAWETRRLLVGGLSSAIASLELVSLADQGTQGGLNRWGDFALYDCSACHHELRVPSLRQENYTSRRPPGRPQLIQWSSPLVETCLDLTDRERRLRLKDQQAQLASQVSSVPFGNQAECQAHVQRLITELNDLQLDIERLPLYAEQAREVMRSLVSHAASSWVDYQAARQISFAIRVAAVDCEHLLSPSSRQAIASLGTDGQSLRPTITFELPDNRAGNLYSPGFLEQELRRMRNFDPAQFKAQLDIIKSSLDPQS